MPHTYSGATSNFDYEGDSNSNLLLLLVVFYSAYLLNLNPIIIFLTSLDVCSNIYFYT